MDLLTIPILNFMVFIYSTLSNNFGLAIIGLTCLMFLITLPLTFRQQRSMKEMQEQQAKLRQDKRYKKIMEKYKGDKQKQQQELLKLQNELGLNPLSQLGGCLLSLVQMPIWIGVFYAIRIALGTTPVEILNLAGYLHQSIPSSLIPLNSKFLWLGNLGQPERLPLPILSNIPFLSEGIPILTIIVVITTWLQTKLQPTAAAADGEGAQMAQSMTLTMPLMMGIIAYTTSAGLALYFVASNFLRLLLAIAMNKINWRNLITRKDTDKSKA